MRARELAAEGRDIIGFGAGEPDFDTPPHICEAGIEAIRSGKTRYTPTAGIPELRRAIAGVIADTRGYDFSLDRIMVSSGAKQALANVILTIVEDGGEVVIPAPYWVSYPEMVTLAEGRSVVVRTREEDGFLLDAAELEKHLTERTRALILNTPSNPTGCVYPGKRLEEIFEVLKGTDVVVISDEIYDRLLYDDAEHVSPLTISDDAAERTVLIGGVSKTYAMTGWRLGYAAGGKDIISAACRIQGHTTSSASSISQAAALAAYTVDDGSTERMRAAFDERRRYMYEFLNSIDGISCRKPLGAFYMFPRVSEYYGRTWGRVKVGGSSAFCEALLDQAGVAAIPGAAFGADEFIRFSYATGMEDIRRGMERFKDFLGQGS